MQKGYLFRTMNARIFWTTVASMLVLAGCEPPQKCNSKENERRPDSLIIVASRLWESNTYQDYLNPIAAEKSTTIHWVNATELTALDLVSTLPKADGILLTGGADVHPGRYGQPQDTISCGSIDQERDSLESILLHWVDHTHLACLGICRGMQFMNVHAGGSLHPHLPEALGSDAHRAGTEENHRDTVHSVVAIQSIAGIKIGEQSSVISHHHQGVHRLSETLESWAQSPDGLCEGLRRRDTVAYPCYLGVQWHPERSELNQPLVESMGEFFIQSMIQGTKDQ